MNKQITSNQHYVPQSLLCHFGWKSKKNKKRNDRINIFDIARLTVRYNQAIAGAFSQNYFYDKDNLIEDFLGTKIEDPASIVINEIVNGNDDIIEIEDNQSILLKFISSLLCRTPEARKKVIALVNTQVESIVREGLRLNGFDPEEASKGHFEFQDYRNLASYITLNGVIDSVILKDLNFHLINNETELEFCISDHPVFTYNWLYRNLKHPGVTGLTARGLQIFLPLSTSKTLCLYDPEIYKYGQKNLVTHVSSIADIEILNSYQIINSKATIGFNARKNEPELRKLFEKHKNIKLHQHESTILEVRENEEGEIKQTHLAFTRQTNLKKMPSFVKIKRKARKDSTSFQERNPDLSAIHYELKRSLTER
ncbi:MAG: DUF4238 domain-containing protein [Coleofasciculaceae cyanobacterium]